MIDVIGASPVSLQIPNQDPAKESNWESLKIVGTSTLAAVTYGIANDLLQKDECPAYWTRGHVYGNPRLVSEEYPALNAVVWGVVATWWAGAIAGVITATVSRADLPGAKRKVSNEQLYRPLAALIALGLPLGEVASRIAKADVFKKIENGYYLYHLVPKANPNLRVSFNDLLGFFSCNARNSTGYLVAGVGTLALSAGILYKRYNSETINSIKGRISP